ncbi:MAG: ABC transporter substrate-binding protein [Thermomicrobiales bacterium]
MNGEATEYTQRRPLPAFTPSGDQVFRITGPIVDPVSIDPALVRDLSSAFLSRLAFRGLVVFDADLVPCLELAEKLIVSADGLTYTFTVDPGALFHNGQNVSADDVAFSLKRSLDSATADGQAALLSGPTFLDSVPGAQEPGIRNDNRTSGCASLTSGPSKSNSGVRIRPLWPNWRPRRPGSLTATMLPGAGSGGEAERLRPFSGHGMAGR